MTRQPSADINRTKLHLALIESFSQSDLRALCYELSIDYDDLPPGGRSDKAWELIAYCNGRTGRLPELLDLCQAQRPNQNWDVFQLPSTPKTSRPSKACATSTKKTLPSSSAAKTLTADLVNYLGDNRFLAVVGASGSGKSSLVRAGLVPALTGQKPVEGADPPAGSDWPDDWPVSSSWRVSSPPPPGRWNPWPSA